MFEKWQRSVASLRVNMLTDHIGNCDNFTPDGGAFCQNGCSSQYI